MKDLLSQAFEDGLWISKLVLTAGTAFSTFRRDAEDVDRNRCDGVASGYCALHVAPFGEILGATVVGKSAGDHISLITLCIQHGLRAQELAGTMFPYPTAAEVVRQAAQAFVRSRIFEASNQELLKTMSGPCEFVRSELTHGLCALDTGHKRYFGYERTKTDRTRMNTHYICYPKGRWYVTGRVRPLAGRVRVCRPSQGRSRDLSVGKPTSHDVP